MPKPRTTANATGAEGANNENASQEEVKSTVTKTTDVKEVVENNAPETNTEEVKETVDNGKTTEASAEDSKDARIAELEKQLADSEEKNSQKDALIKDQQKNIENLSDATLNKSNENTQNLADVAVNKEDKSQLLRVKFLKDHQYTMGTQSVKALKGQTKEVDIATSNKLSARGIAVVINN